MRLITVILFVIISMASALGFTSSQVDSMLLIVRKGGNVSQTVNEFFRFLNKEQFTDSLVSFPSSSSQDAMRREMYYWAGEWYYDKQEYDKALLCVEQALPLFQNNDVSRSDCLGLLAICCVRKGQFASAIRYGRESVEILRVVGDNDRLSSAYNTLAGIYMAAGHPQDARQFIHKGIECAHKADNKGRLAILLGMASEVYAKSGDYVNALAYANRAYTIDSAGGRKPKMAVRLSQRAAALSGLKRYGEAEQAYKSAIAMLREFGNIHSVGIDLNQLGFLYLKRASVVQAIPCFEEAATIFARMGDMYNRVNSHKGLYECYWESDPVRAKKALSMFVKLRDSLYSQSTAEAIARYSVEFSNTQLKTENEMIKQQYEHLKRWQLLLTSVLLLIAVCIVITVFLYVRRRRKEVQITQTDLSFSSASSDSVVRLSSDKVVTPESKGNSGGKAPVDTSDNQFVIALRNAVEQRIKNGSPRVSDIASDLCVSIPTLRRRLKESTGESPKTFVMSIQLERAKKLLTECPLMLIGDVATNSGFEDVKSFSQSFKIFEGISPSAYRKKMM